MTSFVDLCVVLKSFPFQERDKIVVTFTENHGKVTGLAKGAIHSKRFGGSLDLLSCSNIHFVQKNPTAEFLFISEAVTHHEFQGFGKDFEKLSYASFAIEICYHLSETLTPQRELFVALCNFLFHLNQNMSPLLALNAFISKSLKILGYSPSFFRCVKCEKPAHVLLQKEWHWSTQSGGIVCKNCNPSSQKILTDDLLLHYEKLLNSSFKDLSPGSTQKLDSILFSLFFEFLNYHVPGIPKKGLNSVNFISY